MDGYAVAERLRASRALDGTVLAALSGYGQREDRERSRQAGFDDHLVKPVHPDDIREYVRKALQSARVAGRAGA
jgi:CheY-like chemotaxis protein